MTQFDFGTMDANVETGSLLVADLNAWRDAIHTSHRGAVEPSYKQQGMVWLDDSGGVTNVLIKRFDGASWITEGTVNETTNIFTPYVAGAALSAGVGIDLVSGVIGMDIAGLTSEAAPAQNDEVVINDLTAGEERRMTLENFFKVINNLTLDASPVTGDFVVTFDTSAGLAKKVNISEFTQASSPSVPSGAKMLFQTTAAPTGWTKDLVHNNKALRVVTGTVTNAGNTPFTTVFGSGKTTDVHTLTVTEMPSHGHTLSFGLTSSAGETDGSRDGGVAPNETSGSVGGGGSHDHTLSIDLQYVSLIIATKN